jgi:hypothetical protein
MATHRLKRFYTFIEDNIGNPIIWHGAMFEWKLTRVSVLNLIPFHVLVTDTSFLAGDNQFEAEISAFMRHISQKNH